MRKIVLLAFSVIGLGISSGYGQELKTSGYLGKLNFGTVRYNTGITLFQPAKPKAGSDHSDYNGLGSFKSEYEIVAGRTLKNNLAVFVNYGDATWTYDPISVQSSYYWDTDVLDVNSIFGFPEVRDQFKGIGARFYRQQKGAIAPMGMYASLKLDHHVISLDQSMLEYGVEENWNTRFITIQQPDLKFTRVNFVGAVGIVQAITDQVVLDMGFSMGVGFRTVLKTDVSKEENREMFEHHRDALGKVNYAYHLNKVYFGLGFLF